MFDAITLIPYFSPYFSLFNHVMPDFYEEVF